MSKKDIVIEQKEEKVMTKYDLKMQKRQQAKEKEKKEKRIEKLVWAVVIVALVCFIASFPIRSYMAVNETFIKINGEDVSRVEFDYNYNVVKTNYYNQYGSYLSYFGVDITTDLSTQMYSETMTWEDFFQQQAVDSIITGKALVAEAEAAGFSADIEEEYKAYEEEIKATAEELGLSVKNYVQQAYGSYATIDRIEEYIRESIWVNAYYTQLEEENAPSDAEIQAHYEADKASYDSVDYYMTTVDAVLPTEPTELADPVEETEETTEDSTETTEEEVYVPSDAEVEKAMADAKVLADAAVATVTTEGELQENVQYMEASTYINEWLFDEARKEGDTTVIENTISNQYYVLSFVKRYLDETPTANARIIMTTEGNGQAILDEWKNGEATEESFATLAEQYNGGYYEGISPTGTVEAVATWLYEAGRVAGDVTLIDTEDGNQYVVYYAGPNDAEWKMTVRTEILQEFMTTHLEEISADYEVEDTKGNLKYLEILAAETEATGEVTETTETTEAE